jgi:fucose permease
MSHLAGVLVTGLSTSVLGAAGVLAVWSVTSTIVAFQARRLPARIGASERLIAGLATSGVGSLLLADLSTTSSWVRLVPGLLITGVGSGLANAALGRLAVESVPHADAALGSGANNTARYLGSALGIALVAVLLTSGSGQAVDGLVGGWNHAAIVAGAINIAGAGWIASSRLIGARTATASASR